MNTKFFVTTEPWNPWRGGITRTQEAHKAISSIGGVVCSLTRIPYAGVGFMPNFRPWKVRWHVEFQGGVWDWPEHIFGTPQEGLDVLLSLWA